MTATFATPRRARLSTALLDAFERQDTAALMALLDDCRALGVLPMANGRQTLFAMMADPMMVAPRAPLWEAMQAVFTCNILRALKERGMPQAWRQAIGRALLHASTERMSRRGAPPRPRLELQLPMNNTANRGFVMLTCASLRPHQWLKLCRNGIFEHHVPIGLACAHVDHAERGPVLRNMVADGLDIDAPRALVDTTECTMLHAAAARDRADAVALLLELRADPFVTFARPGAAPRDAFTLAPQGGAVRDLLAAWRAQRAMNAVLRPAATQLRGARP